MLGWSVAEARKPRATVTISVSVPPSPPPLTNYSSLEKSIADVFIPHFSSNCPLTLELTELTAFTYCLIICPSIYPFISSLLIQLMGLMQLMGF